MIEVVNYKQHHHYNHFMALFQATTRVSQCQKKPSCALYGAREDNKRQTHWQSAWVPLHLDYSAWIINSGKNTAGNTLEAYRLHSCLNAVFYSVNSDHQSCSHLFTNWLVVVFTITRAWFLVSQQVRLHSYRGLSSGRQPKNVKSHSCVNSAMQPAVQWLIFNSQLYTNMAYRHTNICID